MAQLPGLNIPVIFVNLYTGRRLASALLPLLPASGDFVYLRGLGYEVANCEWTVRPDHSVEIVVALRPQVNEHGERPFSYPEEDET